MTTETILRIEDVYKSFGATQVLNGFSLTIQTQEVVVLVGPSGSGKSTLLRCINLLSPPTSGKIWLEAEEITAPGINQDRVRQRIGMVFQDFNLFTHLTALGNVMIGLSKVRKMHKKEAHDLAMFELERVGLVDRAGHYPAQLSGGQKQRVAIARALGMDPHIMLFDEPTSALDPELTGEVLEVMQQLAREGMTMIVVSHEMGFARQVASQLVFMEAGVVVEQGPPQQMFDAPLHARTRSFLRKISDMDDSGDR